MIKKLVRNEFEYIKLFHNFDLNDAERFLNVEFAFVDGTYQSDLEKNSLVVKDQLIDKNVYRKRENSCFPKKYPCLVVMDNKVSFDRFGLTKFEFLDFVYLSDFEEQ